MTTNFERRIIRQGISLRAAGSGDSMSFGGIGIPYGTYAQMAGYRETVARGASKQWLERAANGTSQVDPACLLNHDPNFLLGRMSNRTLTAEEVSSGVAFNNILDPRIGYHRDTHALIEKRSITGMSWGFKCGQGDDSYDECEDDEDDSVRSRRTGGKFVRRTIRNFSLVTDLSPTVFPAYSSGTNVDARSALCIAIPDTCPREFRSLILLARADDLDPVLMQRRRNLLNSVLS